MPTVIFILCVLYAVGIVGATLPLHQDFLLLTPLNLIVCMALVLAVHEKQRRQGLALGALLCYLGGFALEIIGVQTGVLFGEYSYGAVLGPKLLGTPYLIGLNWFMLIYCIGALNNRWMGAGRPWLKAFATALLMTLTDTLIEPVAVANDFWSWGEGQAINAYLVAPWQNYAMWFVGGLVLSRIFVYFQDWYQNSAAEVLFSLQILFFGSLYIQTLL